MDNDNVQELISIVNRMVGKPCWATCVTPSTGSRFILDLGRELRRPRTRPKPNQSADYAYGEFKLSVGCAAWRLDSKSEIITAWTDDNSVGGPMDVGLSVLRGTTVTDAEVGRPWLDLVLEFDGKYWLRVFCDQLDEMFSNYTVSFRDTYVADHGRCCLTIERGTGESGPGEGPEEGPSGLEEPDGDKSPPGLDD